MAHTRSISRPIIVAMPRRAGRVRRAGRRAGRVARRVGHHARSAAPTGGILLAAAALGYGKQKGYLKKLPVIGGSPNLTLGIAGYLARRYSGNAHIKNAGLAAMIVSAYSFGNQQAGGTAGEEGEEGDDGAFGDDAAV